MPHNYSDRLHQAIHGKATPALVGLDPRFDLLPESVQSAARTQGGGTTLIDLSKPL